MNTDKLDRMIDKPVVVSLMRHGNIVHQRGLLWHYEVRRDEGGPCVTYISLQLDCAAGKETLRHYAAENVLWIREDR